ncbi:MAG TPA: SMP-30/gluconolactonase/LRE family protein [Solirubrobacteraceae bacterium]|nr:SMP-30/gluconolactonase/LRE family protein [Solirubrobacteraceae bacterium]
MSSILADPSFAAYAPGFDAVAGDSPRLWRVAKVDAHEGPVYFADEDAVYFTSVPRPGSDRSPAVQIKRLALDEPDRVSVVVDEANGANGMTADREGNLIVCEQGSRWAPARITRLDRSTSDRETLVDDWRGLPLNSPNDVIVAGDGAIWFTDPSYGHLQGFRPAPMVGDYVYRHDPASGETTVVADGFDKPNGIAFSPDERILYVTDSGANQEPGSYHVTRPHHIKAFDVTDGRMLTGERLFAVVTPGFPDGLKVDSDGRVYASSFSGVQVFDPGGELLGEIQVPGAVNFCFGGAERDLLLITTDSAVWAAALAAKGA